MRSPAVSADRAGGPEVMSSTAVEARVVQPEVCEAIAFAGQMHAVA